MELLTKTDYTFVNVMMLVDWAGTKKKDNWVNLIEVSKSVLVNMLKKIPYKKKINKKILKSVY